MENTTQANQEEVKNVSENKLESYKKPMTLTKKIFYGIIAVIVFFLAVQISVADKYKATVQCIEGEKKVGVNPTDLALDFGDLSHDTAAQRIIKMNSGSRSAYVYIAKFGQIAELIKVSEARFTMKPNEEKKIQFDLYMPPSAPTGVRMDGWVWVFKLPKIF
jgi:hypothetical protein